MDSIKKCKRGRTRQRRVGGKEDRMAKGRKKRNLKRFREKDENIEIKYRAKPSQQNISRIRECIGTHKVYAILSKSSGT